MPIRLFNTASQQLEVLESRNGRVSLYVCGVTPYDTTHAGHAFTYVIFDTLVRFLTTMGLAVTYAQNVTDIDDDILRKANEMGIPFDELGRRETDLYVEDMRDLNVIAPDHFIRATDVIPEIVESIEELFSAGFAYQSQSNVYFDSRLCPDYGAIAHTDRPHLIELAREHGGSPDDPAKRDPLDFLLWQGQLPGEPSWPSRFGPGRPGWHIECSTISRLYLGVPVDIHGGGKDLIFPHHASELAEVEAFEDRRPFVRCWMHTAMVRMDGQKMSKSLGNIAFVRDLLDRYCPDAIRLYLLSHHYRREFEYSEQELIESAGLSDLLSRLAPEVARTEDHNGPEVDAMKEAMATDLNTPAVVGQLRRLASAGSHRNLTPDEASAVHWAGSVLGLELNATAPLTAIGGK